MPKLPTPLTTIFVEIFTKKCFGEVLDLYQLPHGRNFEYLEKNGILKFLERVFCPGNFSGSCYTIVRGLFTFIIMKNLVKLLEAKPPKTDQIFSHGLDFIALRGLQCIEQG